MCIQRDNFIVWEWDGEVRGWGLGSGGSGRRTIGLNVIVSKFSLIQSISNRFKVSIHHFIGMP